MLQHLLYTLLKENILLATNTKAYDTVLVS